MASNCKRKGDNGRLSRRHNFTTLASVCNICDFAVQTSEVTCVLPFGTPGVKYCKAKRTITVLHLDENKIGDKGACALADTLRATLVTCLPHVLPTPASGHDGYTLTMPDSNVFCSLSAGLFLQLCSGQPHMPELHGDRNPHGHK